MELLVLWGSASLRFCDERGKVCMWIRVRERQCAVLEVLVPLDERSIQSCWIGTRKVIGTGIPRQHVASPELPEQPRLILHRRISTMSVTPEYIYIVTSEKDMSPSMGRDAGSAFETLGIFWTVEEANARARTEAENAELDEDMPDSDDEDEDNWPEWYQKNEDGCLSLSDLESVERIIS